MKLKQTDIGGELISIITKGMYADPKDALREYVQNGVDAEASDITIKIRQNNIVVQDTGNGMDKIKMRKAVRVGMSDKNPKHSVGFMGIGLYSSFHLCDILTIYSKIEGDEPNKLIFRFKEMRDLLQSQKDRKIDNNIEEDQIALLELLEKHIDFVTLDSTDFPRKGTRIEMSGLEPSFFKSLSKFDEVSEYLERVVPLPFDPEFKYGVTIQNYISKVCKKHDAEFKIVNLSLEINGEQRSLYRPYKDKHFKPLPLPPKFKELKSPDGFLGVAWGCLNQGKIIIPEERLRGFLIKKHGFTIGKRSDLLPYFNRATFFNRYMGEFIVVHPKLLPNAPRSDFEYSSLRTTFYAALGTVAQEFNQEANDYQEEQKANEDLEALIEQYKSIAAELPYVDGTGDRLLELHRELITSTKALEKKIKKFSKEKEKAAQTIIKQSSSLITEIRHLISAKEAPKKRGKKVSVADKIQKAPKIAPNQFKEPEPDNFTEALELIGIPLTDDIKKILNLIDERFIRPSSKNEENYKSILTGLKNDIEELFGDEN